MKVGVNQVTVKTFYRYSNVKGLKRTNRIRMDHMFKELNLSGSKETDEEYGRAPIEVLSKVRCSTVYWLND